VCAKSFVLVKHYFAIAEVPAKANEYFQANAPRLSRHSAHSGSLFSKIPNNHGSSSATERLSVVQSGMRYFDPKRDSTRQIWDHYTGVGEVLAIPELDQVFGGLRRKICVKRGSLFSLDDAKNSGLIFVGSPSENLYPFRSTQHAGVRFSATQ
jgi:hypothetical protein